MMKNIVPALGILVLAACCTRESETDICIYGGTSAGVVAAYSAHQLGKKVVLTEPSAYLGGLSSGGLGATDIGNKYAVTGIARDFYRKLGDHYGKLEMWTFAPHVAESIFNAYVSGEKTQVLKNYRLKKVIKEGTRIREVVLVSTVSPLMKPRIRIRAKMFLDCSYEGDLMARAGVTYTVGREDNSLYHETLNGVQLLDKHQFPDSIDPYVVPGNPASGICYGINPEPLQPAGSGDRLVQAYNYRLCLTQDTTNMIAITAPADYDPSKYELLKRVIAQREKQGWKHVLNSYLSIIMMPEGKTDINNNGPFSTDFINNSWNYPEADYRTRLKIAKAHADYIKGLLYFLGHDESVPEELHSQMLSWGYARDEFPENGGFPRQLYVREARRMVGEYVMTEHHCRGAEVTRDDIGMAAYTMDSHNCQRVVVNGMVKNEGDVQVGGFPPYPISYYSLTPKREECTNLLVPVCLSATHIAYGSIRMEPVFMVLGQSATMAASMAIDNNGTVQEVDVKALQVKLSADPYLDGRPPEVLVDNADSGLVTTGGNWETYSRWMGQYKTDCMIFSGNQRGKQRVRFIPPRTLSGSHDLYYYCPPSGSDFAGWTCTLPVVICDGAKTHNVIADLQSNQNGWLFLGNYVFSDYEPAYVEVVADTISLPAVADAVMWIPHQN
jgi:hypothetical protein